MFIYNFQQWMMFFFLYCFLGWVWETCYVSVRKRKLVNRGFLHGPMLPIYGFGAIGVLAFTLPVRENLVTVYISGMIGATCLEYLSGAVIEKLFHVRYWDYSKVPWNLHGYICLKCSLAWGVFSVLMIQYIQPFVQKYVFQIPEQILLIIDGFVFCVFCVDTTVSAIEAWDLRTILAQEKEKELQRLHQKITLLTESVNTMKTEKKGQLDTLLGERKEWLLHLKMEEREKLLLLSSELEQRKAFLVKKSEQRYQNAQRILRRNPDATFQKERLNLDEFLEKVREETKKISANHLKEILEELKSSFTHV